jgi:hypothetical protein
MSISQPPTSEVSYARKVFAWLIIGWQALTVIVGLAVGEVEKALVFLPFWALIVWALLHPFKKQPSA